MTSPASVRLPVPGGLQLSLKMSVAGQDAVCVLGGWAGADGPSAAIATAWRDHAWSSFRPLIADSATCTGAILRDSSKVDGLVFEVGPPATPAGSGGFLGGVLAASTLIKWSTTAGGRSGKGRTFLPGLPGAGINSDQRTYAAAHAAKVTTAVSAYLSQAGLSAAGVAPAVLSFRKGSHGVIVSGGLAPVIGIQRRRMR